MTDLKNFKPCGLPGQNPLLGQYVNVLPIDWDLHGEPLFQAISGPNDDVLWTYLPFLPFKRAEDFIQMFCAAAAAFKWEMMVICAPGSGKVLGTASYMRIRQNDGSCEVGCVAFSDELKQSRAATEAIYLMARHAFEDLGFRRFEWKCDDDNAASKRAALRFGFAYEGLFRNDRIVKEKNRDTAWFSMIDSEWPYISAGFKRWLDSKNFGSNGQQIATLKNLRETATAP